MSAKASIVLGMLSAEVEFGFDGNGEALSVKPLKMRLLLRSANAPINGEPVEIGYFTYLDQDAPEASPA